MAADLPAVGSVWRAEDGTVRDVRYAGPDRLGNVYVAYHQGGYGHKRSYDGSSMRRSWVDWVRRTGAVQVEPKP